MLLSQAKFTIATSADLTEDECEKLCEILEKALDAAEDVLDSQVKNLASRFQLTLRRN